jgi:chromosome segregation protein
LVYKAGRLLSHATKAGDTEVARELRTAQVQLERAMTRRETAIEHQTNLTITQRSLEIDAAHLQALQKRLTADLAHARGLAGDHDSRQAERTALGVAMKAADRFLEKLRGQLQLARRQLETAGGQAGATTAVAQAATQLEQLRSRRQAAEERLEAIRSGLAALTGRRHELGRQARAWRITASPTTRPAAKPATIERSLIALEAELLARQDLQRGAVTEYQEVKIRYEELAAQIADLTQARADLGRVVEQLNGVIRERFKENFAALGQHFSAYFTRLFGGGSAGLDLEEAEDGTYGIIIQASPKGKRQGNLAALSGGERAMAGVALLAAILRVNPSPFVVLDEVDAALDEANSGRLSGILDELAEASQLIIITHNRQTMKAAKTLFGVTMNEHHVSHLLSMRLEEASAIAAR